MTSDVQRMMQLGLLTAIALALSVLDLRITIISGVPGMKIGLANIVTLLALVLFNVRAVLLMVTARTCLGALLGGSWLGPAFFMSVGAGIVSCIVMSWAYYRWQPQLSMIGISVAGAAAHNVVQITIAALLLSSLSVYSYLPYMLLTGTLAGALMGYIVVPIVKRLPYG